MGSAVTTVVVRRARGRRPVLGDLPRLGAARHRHRLRLRRAREPDRRGRPPRPDRRRLRHEHDRPHDRRRDRRRGRREHPRRERRRVHRLPRPATATRSRSSCAQPYSPSPSSPRSWSRAEAAPGRTSRHPPSRPRPPSSAQDRARTASSPSLHPTRAGTLPSALEGDAIHLRPAKCAEIVSVQRNPPNGSGLFSLV